jgi:ATP-dependent helicase/nuclease subunit B
VAITVVATGYGRAASQRLHDAVAAAKRDDPLAPVTVIVPTNSVGVAARRRLARGERGPLTDRGRGVVGVNFLTVYRLAELLAASACAAAGRRPVSTPVVAAAVRRVLAQRPGIFAPVATHPATEEALVGAHRELAALDDEHVDRLGAQNVRTHEVVRIHRATRTALARDWYDERDLMGVALDRVRSGTPLLRDLGTIVCFLPQRWSTPAARLLRALADVMPTTVIVGLTGAATADAAVVASLARVGIHVGEACSAIEPVAGTEVISASDADDEVRAIVRGVVDAMRNGIPLERMAVLYGSHEPYARLLHEHLHAAGIAHNGAATRTLADSVLGRTLLGFFAIRDAGFRREDVTALFATAPLLDGRGARVPSTEWERISRKAGIVRGTAEWRARLQEYARVLKPEGWDARERARADALRMFIDELAAALESAHDAESWAGHARWAHRLVRRFLGDDARRGSWPPLEQEAARRVEAALDRLAGLDTVDTNPSVEVFRRTFELELAAAHDRVGRLGEGVLAGPVGLALGVELDHVWVCGLAEGIFPSVPRDDPLLGDAERSVLDGELQLRAERVDNDQRALLAALASTTGARVCSWPRGDLRRSTEHVPSRYLYETLATLDRSESRTIASYAQGVATAGFPPTEHELGVRAALAAEAWTRELREVGRACELLEARASDAFTRFDGNLSGVREELATISPLDSERAISPTRLELWAGCPHAYLMQAILHVEAVDRPEEILQLSPLDRGSIVHDVLDRFVGDGAATRERLRALAEEACAGAEARGITGRRLLWDRDRRMILADLDAFARADERFRDARAAETLATELPFGLPSAANGAVELQWPDGRRLRVRGKADRIDRAADGTLIVIDYKTGSVDPYVALNADDPVRAGTRLQLPVYAYAARAAFAGDGDDHRVGNGGGAGDRAPVEAYYWFVGRGNNRLIGYAVDAAVHDLFMQTVRTIGESIEAGVFVANPPPPGPRPFVTCPYCDPDGFGTADRWREWERKYVAPELAAYRKLIGEDGMGDA